MKTFVLWVFCFICVGCGTILLKPDQRITNLRQTALGMTKQEVSELMREDVIIGYEMIDHKTNAFGPITTKNPQRVQRIEQDGKFYDVVFYFTHIQQADGAITDDELTPFIFEKDILIGKGWFALTNLLKKR